MLNIFTSTGRLKVCGTDGQIDDSRDDTHLKREIAVWWHPLNLPVHNYTMPRIYIMQEMIYESWAVHGRYDLMIPPRWVEGGEAIAVKEGGRKKVIEENACFPCTSPLTYNFVDWPGKQWMVIIGRVLAARATNCTHLSE